ncbi:MAG: uroporphyrinogen decarboxylase family protein [Verrucomicrobiota bacterium]
MTPRENLLGLYRRQGYSEAPVYFELCKSLQEEFKRRYPDAESIGEHFGFPVHVVPWDPVSLPERNFDLDRYYPEGLAEGTRIDVWGVAHEPGSEAAAHMTRMHHPMKDFEELEDFENYPWPDFQNADFSHVEKGVEEAHRKGLAAYVPMAMTIWETAWYLRSMEALMMDMLEEDEKATYLLDWLTDSACYRIELYSRAGADIIALGDDIGMQDSIMMSEDMYRMWLKPRLKKVIDAAKAVKPDIIIQYHSCGYITPFISDLIEVGVDVLNPVQPECMDFAEIHAEFGGRLSFNGTIGTQTTMPFGTTDEVRETTIQNLDIAGTKGGLLCCPTHLLEPEVPWENIEAYAEACREYKPSAR